MYLFCVLFHHFHLFFLAIFLFVVDSQVKCRRVSGYLWGFSGSDPPVISFLLFWVPVAARLSAFPPPHLLGRSVACMSGFPVLVVRFLRFGGMLLTPLSLHPKNVLRVNSGAFFSLGSLFLSTRPL